MSAAVLTGCLLLPLAADPAPVEVSARRPETVVTVLREEGATVLDVVCPFGIDRATLRRTGDAWPDPLTVRLHLKGLEGFQAADGTTTVRTAVGTDGAVRSELRRGRDERPLDADDPWTPAVRVVEGRTPADHVYEVTLPRRLFQENPPELSLLWIDFYRD